MKPIRIIHPFSLILLALTSSCGSDTSSGTQLPLNQTYTIGGSITGLSASGLVLKNNGGDNLAVATSATSFQFATSLSSGASYSVTVGTEPSSLSCSLSNASGTVGSSNVTNILLTCTERPGSLTSVTYSSASGGVTTYTGTRLDWLGSAGTSYLAAFNFGSPPTEGGPIGGWMNGTYNPGSTSSSVPGGARPAFHYLCPAGTTRYSSAVCTNSRQCF